MRDNSIANLEMEIRGCYVSTEKFRSSQFMRVMRVKNYVHSPIQTRIILTPRSIRPNYDLESIPIVSF